MSNQLDQFRKIIQDKTSRQPPLLEVERVPQLSTDDFRAYAIDSKPVIMTQAVNDWPLLQKSMDQIREELGQHPVKVRVGDYVSAAFSPDREFVTMPLSEYLDLIAKDGPESDLPPYVGNNDLPGPLRDMTIPPPYYPKGGYTEPRLWLGPKGAVTALHYDFADNLYVQIWGRKQFILFPPHDEPKLSTWDASDQIKASRFNPENPDYESFPLCRQASPVKCVLERGEMLFLPGGWFHHVRAVDISFSVNFFVVNIRPLAAFPAGTRL